MANLRPVLLMTLAFLGYLLWVEWQRDYGPRPAVSPGIMDSQSITQDNAGQAVPIDPSLPSASEAPQTSADLPPVNLPPGSSGEREATQTLQAERPVITVTTDVLEAQIDPVGGTMVSARLLNYPQELDKPDVKVQLFTPEGVDFFIAQSGLLSRQAAPNHTTPYETARQDYALTPGAEEIRVPLTWTDAGGIEVTKTFIFARGQYEVAVRHTLTNNSSEVWSGSRYDQLQRAVAPDEEKGGFNDPGRYSFKGIGFYSPEEKFEKVDFNDVASDPFKRSFSDGWLGMIQHYFFAAWIPPAGQVNAYSTQELNPSGLPRYIARAVSPVTQVAPGTNHEFNSRLYVGPKLQDELQDIAPGLEHTVNYGIFTVFSKPLFWLLSHIHDFVGNWGWAIILLTVLIKLAFFKLTEAQYRSMARMRKLQPRIEALKERYGDDRQRMSQAMMEMYRKEKVNPLGGCLPILVQIPIFIALYWVLLESVELRQAPFVGWIDNLSKRDPYFILPALNAVFMILTQRLTPTAGMDPLQRKMMNAMPVVFSVMFAFFPAGLVLYWATNAGLSLAQQWYITRKIAGTG
jgi:YidC/Oxa1 family membrane protein insertase